LVKAEEAVCENIADNGLVKICEKVETRIKQGYLSEEERKELVDEIRVFIDRNYYQKAAYENRRQAVDALLNKLLDQEYQDGEQSFLEKYF